MSDRLELDGKCLPEFSPTAASAVRNRQHARTILRAYYEPEIQHPCDDRWPDREIRIADDVHLVVSMLNGAIIAVADYEPPAPAERSPVLAPRHRGQRRIRGGAGTRIPTTLDELLSNARARGALVRRASRHWRVSVPGNPHAVTVAFTASDWRALQNTVSQCRNILKLDLRRDRDAQ